MALPARLLSAAGRSTNSTSSPPQGGLLWSYTFGTDADSFGVASSVRFTPSGDIAASGSFSGTVDLGGGPLKAEDDDALVMLLSGDGKHLWSHSLGGVGRQYGHAIAVDETGQLVLGGTFLEAAKIGADSYVNPFHDAQKEGTQTFYDGFLGFLSPTGDVQSSLPIQSMWEDAVDDLHFTSEGALMLTGYAEDAFTLREFVDGKPGWTWSTPHIKYARSAANHDSVSIAVGIEDTFDLGAGGLASRGSDDLVLVKIQR